MSKYTERIAELVKCIETTNRFPKICEYTNLEKKESTGRIMIEDLGDSMPFLWWAGEQIDEKYKTYADETAKKWIQQFQENNGLFRMTEERGRIQVYNFDKMTDISLGINLMYTLTNEKEYADAAKRFFNEMGRIIKKNKGFLSIYGLNKMMNNIGFSTGKLGLYAEELCNFYKQTNDEQYVQAADEMVRIWIENPFFQKNGLFPFMCKPKMFKPIANHILKKHIGFGIDTAMSSKANTNLVYGINAVYKITKEEQLKEALEKWVNGVTTKLKEADGSLFNIWDGKGQFKFLGCDHAVIDTLLELSRTFKNKNYRDDAEKIVNFWLKQQDESGLVQQGVKGYSVCVDPKMKWGKETDFFRLDPQTDFFVVLMKLYHITEKEKYKTAAIKLIDGICLHHEYEGGFVEILNQQKKKIDMNVETKFLFLIIKALSFELYKKSGQIYNNHKIECLLRDR